MTKLFLTLASTVILSGCADAFTGGNSGAGQQKTDHDLQSLWTSQNEAWTLNLTKANTQGSAFLVQITMVTGAKCICSMVMQGNAERGNCSFGNCIHNGGPNPTCEEFNGGCESGYSYSPNQLQFGTLHTYH